MITLGAPGFAITNVHWLANWKNQGNDVNFSDIKYQKFDSKDNVKKFTSFSDYVNSTRKSIEYNKELSEGTSTGFLLTSNDIGLMNLEFSFGESYIAPKLIINCLDPKNSFESNVLTDFLTLVKSFKNSDGAQYYISFGHGDNLSYWTNFLTFKLIGIRRTNNPNTSDQLTLEFIPGAGIADSNDNILINSLKELQFKQDSGVVVAKKIPLYDEEYNKKTGYFKTVLYKIDDNSFEGGELKLRPTTAFSNDRTNQVIKAIFLNFKYQLQSILSSSFSDSNIILSFSDDAITNKVKEITQYKQATDIILNDKLSQAVADVGNFLKTSASIGNQIIDKNYVLSILEVLNPTKDIGQFTLGTDIQTDPKVKSNAQYMFGDFITNIVGEYIEHLGAGYKHYLKLEIKANKIIEYIEFLKNQLTTLNGENTIDMVFYREFDTTILEIWEKHGIIKDSKKPCIILGDKLSLQANLYGSPIGGETTKALKAVEVAKDIKKFNSFDLSIYGMDVDFSDRKIQALLKTGVQELIRYNKFPIFRYNQQFGNVSNLSIEDNMLYFANFNKTIKLLRNYSGAKTRLEGDISIPTYYKQQLVGNLTYKTKAGVNRTLDLSKDNLSELLILKEAFLSFVESNTDSKFLELLKAGDLSSARNIFKQSITDNKFALAGYDPNDDTLDILFDVIFEKLQKDSALVYYVEHELKNNIFALEYDLFNNINKQMFKIDITTLPMFKICNFSFIGIPCVFLYDELPIAGLAKEGRDFLSGLYIITGVKHVMTPTEISSNFILRKSFRGNYANS